MPYRKEWVGPHLTLVCPRCTQEYRVTLHDGFLPCPHDELKSRGDCSKCQSEAMMEGRPIPAATPPPPPTPPPAPSDFFSQPQGKRFTLDQMRAAYPPESDKDPHFNEREPFIPPQFNPNDDDTNS